MSKMYRVLLCLIAVGLAVSAPARAGSSGELLQKVRAYRTAHAPDILREFVQLLAIPNVASDRANIRRNADEVAQMLERRGFKPQLLQLSSEPEVPPLVYAQWRV